MTDLKKNAHLDATHQDVTPTPITTVSSALMATPLLATNHDLSVTTIQLDALSARFIVLYFYPKDNTPGCTSEAQDFASHYTKFTAQDIAVIGVSRDDVSSHNKFIAKFDLPFPLIADVDEKLCTALDVIKLKNMYGKQVRGIERSTFVINQQGEILKEWRKVKVEGHVAAVIEYLNTLDSKH